VADPDLGKEQDQCFLDESPASRCTVPASKFELFGRQMNHFTMPKENACPSWRWRIDLDSKLTNPSNVQTVKHPFERILVPKETINGYN
jgi:hypothetical protein